MTNDHSVRSPSTGGGSALRRTLSESPHTVRAGMREALHYARNTLSCVLDSSPAVQRARDETIARIDAALQIPEAEIQSSPDLCAGGIDPGWDGCPKCGASSDESCKFDGPSEANSPAAPVWEPCGYLYSLIDGGREEVFTRARRSEYFRNDPWTETPLYAAPVDAGVLWNSLKEICASSKDKSAVKALVMVREEDIAAALSSQPVVRVDQK